MKNSKLWLFYSLFCLLSITNCQTPQNENNDLTENDSLRTDAPSTVANFSENAKPFEGTFEYDGGAWEYGYLFYRLEMTQNGESLEGKMFLGNYLSKSAAGGYVMPDATMEIDLHGEVRGAREAIIFPDRIRDSIATDTSSRYPDLSNVFVPDANDDLLQLIRIDMGKMEMTVGTDTLRWDKVK